MLDNIKSTYFTKMVFYFLDEKRKLKIIKYNKSSQNFLNISLINYKILSGKYIILETNKKGKEYIYNYFGDILVYEGEYLNGEKNGKGKEYYSNNNLKFEGEYLKGKRNGKGKEYNFYGTLIFEGEYIDGKIWNGKGNQNGYEIKDGKGFITDYYGYYGEYLNGKPNGIGREYNNNSRFLGEYLNGERNGKGKEYNFFAQLIFEGEYLKGKKWNGKVLNYDVNEIKNGKGYIKEFYDYENNLIFEGHYLYGQRNGMGKVYNEDNQIILTGEFKNGVLNGKVKE